MNRLERFVPLVVFVVLVATQRALSEQTWQIVAKSDQIAPGTGYPFKNFETPAINERSQVSFLGYAQTDIPTECGRGGTGCFETRTGAWLASNANAVPLAVQGETLPLSGGPISRISELIVNNSGVAALKVQLASGYSGIYQNAGGVITPVAVPGQSTGQDAFTFGTSINFPTLSDDGQIVFRANAKSPTSTDSVTRYWVSLNGQLTNGPRFYNDRFGFSDAGKVAYTRVDSSTPYVYGLYLGDLQSQQIALKANTPAVGAPANFGYPQQPDVNDNAHFVAHVTLGPLTGPVAGTGIWTGDATSVIPIAISGQNAPGTSAQFNEFNYRPQLNNNEQSAFVAFLSGAGIDNSNDAGIWSGTPGSLSKVVQQGDAAPGTNALFGELALARSGATYNWTVEYSPFAFNDGGQVAFIAQLTGDDVTPQNDFGLWAQSRAGELQLILREGDFVELSPGDSRQVSDIQMRFGYGEGLNDLGQLAFKVVFADGSQALLLNNQVAVPEPTVALYLLLFFATTLVTSRRLIALPSRG